MEAKVKSQQSQMKWILFWTFLALFVLIVIGTLAMVFFGFGSPTENERSIMVKGLILEVGTCILALFYSIFGINKSSEKIHEIQSEKIQELSLSIEELRKRIDLTKTSYDHKEDPITEKNIPPEIIEYKSEVESILDDLDSDPPFPTEIFKLNPRPKQIYLDLTNTKPFDLKHRENSYIGRKIQWKAAFKTISSTEKGIYRISARLEYVYLLAFEVDEANSHFFRNLNSNTAFWVCGEILEINSLYIKINNAVSSNNCNLITL